MASSEHIAFLIPSIVGGIAFVCTTLIHALPLAATVNLVRRERKLGRAGVSFWLDFSIVARAIIYALGAHLLEVALWAGVFILCGEFRDFGTAYYHSAMNYSTLGYGDIVMSPTWRLLGPLEAADGLIMYGLTTAMVFAVVVRLFEARFTDLKT